jgi:hypothetical protein
MSDLWRLGLGHRLGLGAASIARSPLQLGASNWWRAADANLSGSDVISITDTIGAVDLLTTGGNYPTYDSGEVVHDGISQYLYSTDATLLGRVNGDDESASYAIKGKLLSITAGPQFVCWTTNAGTQLFSVFFQGGAQSWRMQRISTAADSATGLSDLTEQTWIRVANAGANTWTKNGPTTVHSADLSAAATWTPAAFMVGARYTTGPIPIQFAAMRWKHIAVFPTALSAAQEAALRAYMVAA